MLVLSPLFDCYAYTYKTLSGDVNATVVPGIGLKRLLGVGELYNCAVTVTEPILKFIVTALLKKAVATISLNKVTYFYSFQDIE